MALYYLVPSLPSPVPPSFHNWWSVAMVDWHSPEVILNEARAFSWSLHVFLGLYTWEFVCSLRFDWCYLTRRRKFEWPLAFYFACRYSLLLTMIAVTIAANVSREFYCRPLFLTVDVAGHAAIGFACINFAIRTIILWDGARWLVVVFSFVTLGHWALILQPGIINTAFSSLGGCYVSGAKRSLQTATFAYSLAFDLLSLVLIAIKLPLRGSSLPLRLLHHDTFVYVFVASTLNCLAATFMCLDLNSVMAYIFVFPSAVCSTIMATRCVRDITNDAILNSSDLFGRSSTVLFRRDDAYTDHTLTTTQASHLKRPSNGVQIQMQTFVIVDEDSEEPSRPADVESQVLPSESSCAHNS